MSDCLLGFENCGAPDPCPTRVFWRRIRDEIEQELKRLTLAEVIQASGAGLAVSI
jgi:DNA-binding IscR family transcriptional regulator